jgi:hypothetical protein
MYQGPSHVNSRRLPMPFWGDGEWAQIREHGTGISQGSLRAVDRG